MCRRPPPGPAALSGTSSPSAHNGKPAAPLPTASERRNTALGARYEWPFRYRTTISLRECRQSLPLAQRLPPPKAPIPPAGLRRHLHVGKPPFPCSCLDRNNLVGIPTRKSEGRPERFLKGRRTTRSVMISRRWCPLGEPKKKPSPTRTRHSHEETARRRRIVVWIEAYPGDSRHIQAKPKKFHVRNGGARPYHGEELGIAPSKILGQSADSSFVKPPRVEFMFGGGLGKSGAVRAPRSFKNGRHGTFLRQPPGGITPASLFARRWPFALGGNRSRHTGVPLPPRHFRRGEGATA